MKMKFQSRWRNCDVSFLKKKALQLKTKKEDPSMFSYITDELNYELFNLLYYLFQEWPDMQSGKNIDFKANVTCSFNLYMFCSFLRQSLCVIKCQCFFVFLISYIDTHTCMRLTVILLSEFGTLPIQFKILYMIYNVSSYNII